MSPHKNKLKGFAAAGLALSSVLGLAAVPNVFAEGSSSYFDANAEQCIIDSYNATSGQSVTTIEEVDFESVTALNCANRNIAHFRGIVLFPNLEHLDLRNNLSLAVSYMDFSQNTKLKYLDLTNTGAHYSIDLSNSPDLEYIRGYSSYATDMGGYMILYHGVERLNDDDEYAYGVDFNNFKFVTDYPISILVNEAQYPYTYNESTRQLLFKDATKIPYTIQFSNEYMTYAISPRTGYVNYRVFFEGDEEIETHNPINVNNNCEAVQYAVNANDEYLYYYSCNNNVYEGDIIDTDATKTDLLDKIFNTSDYELSEVEIVPPTANINLTVDTDTVKKGTILPGANFTLDFHFAIKSNDVPSTPSAPNTGLFTKDDGSVSVENILLALAGLSVAAFLVLGASRRFSARSRARKF